MIGLETGQAAALCLTLSGVQKLTTNNNVYETAVNQRLTIVFG